MPAESYERLLLKQKPYFCSIPKAEAGTNGATGEQDRSKAEQEKDLVTAASRGWELLQPLEGKCLYLVSGWWSYSFCYKSQIKQFHQLPPGKGGPVYPLQEDPGTPAYVLGRFANKKPQEEPLKTAPSTELQTNGDTRYLVQRLDGGTICDLTGKKRRIEVQFHCHPHSTDRIGWIKETSTCAYVMIIYTPRLCSDMAFLPPKQDRAQQITCREILKPDQVAEWKEAQASQSARSIGPSTNVPLMAGGVEIGGMKEVGRDGRHIEKGKVVTTLQERVETVAMQKDGVISTLSIEDLQVLHLDPEAVETFWREIKDLAKGRDWRVEKFDDEKGNTQLRGLVAGDDDGTTADGESGSEEAYREDI